MRTEKKEVFCSFQSFCVNYFENSTVGVVISLSSLILWKVYAFESQNKNCLTTYRLSLKVDHHVFSETGLSNSSWPCGVSTSLNQGLANIINESPVEAWCLYCWHLPHLVVPECRFQNILLKELRFWWLYNLKEKKGRRKWIRFWKESLKLFVFFCGGSNSPSPCKRIWTLLSPPQKYCNTQHQEIKTLNLKDHTSATIICFSLNFNQQEDIDFSRLFLCSINKSRNVNYAISLVANLVLPYWF